MKSIQKHHEQEDLWLVVLTWIKITQIVIDRDEKDSWKENGHVAGLNDRVWRKAAFAKKMTIWLLCRRRAGVG